MVFCRETGTKDDDDEVDAREAGWSMVATDILSQGEWIRCGETAGPKLRGCLFEVAPFGKASSLMSRKRVCVEFALTLTIAQDSFSI